MRGAAHALVARQALRVRNLFGAALWLAARRALRDTLRAHSHWSMDSAETTLRQALAAYTPVPSLSFSTSGDAQEAAAVPARFRVFAEQCVFFHNRLRVAPLLAVFNDVYAKIGTALAELVADQAWPETDLRRVALLPVITWVWTPAIWAGVLAAATATAATADASSTPTASMVAFRVFRYLLSALVPLPAHLQARCREAATDAQRATLVGHWQALMSKGASDAQLAVTPATERRRVVQWAATFLGIWDFAPDSRFIEWDFRDRLVRNNDPFPLAVLAPDELTRTMTFYKLWQHVATDPYDAMDGPYLDAAAQLFMAARGSTARTHQLVPIGFSLACSEWSAAADPAQRALLERTIYSAPACAPIRRFFTRAATAEKRPTVLVWPLTSSRSTDKGSAIKHFSVLVFSRADTTTATLAVTHFDSLAGAHTALAENMRNLVTTLLLPPRDSTNLAPQMGAFDTPHTQTGSGVECGIRTLGTIHTLLSMPADTAVATTETMTTDDARAYLTITVIPLLKKHAADVLELRYYLGTLPDDSLVQQAWPDDLKQLVAWREADAAFTTCFLWDERLKLVQTAFRAGAIDVTRLFVRQVFDEVDAPMLRWLSSPRVELFESELVGLALLVQSLFTDSTYPDEKKKAFGTWVPQLVQASLARAEQFTKTLGMVIAATAQAFTALFPPDLTSSTLVRTIANAARPFRNEIATLVAALTAQASTDASDATTSIDGREQQRLLNAAEDATAGAKGLDLLLTWINAIPAAASPVAPAAAATPVAPPPKGPAPVPAPRPAPPATPPSPAPGVVTPDAAKAARDAADKAVAEAAAAVKDVEDARRACRDAAAAYATANTASKNAAGELTKAQIKFKNLAGAKKPDAVSAKEAAEKALDAAERANDEAATHLVDAYNVWAAAVKTLVAAIGHAKAIGAKYSADNNSAYTTLPLVAPKAPAARAVTVPSPSPAGPGRVPAAVPRAGPAAAALMLVPPAPYVLPAPPPLLPVLPRFARSEQDAPEWWRDPARTPRELDRALFTYTPANEAVWQAEEHARREFAAAAASNRAWRRAANRLWI